MSRSFEKFSYLLRANKNVERKLIVSLLASLAKNQRYDLSNYRYVGFGCMWFPDFILMHKLFHISTLITIEKELSREGRVKFNKPYACVDVKMGAASAVIPELDWTQATITWLDYDDPLLASMFADFQATITRMKSGDVLFITVNADSAQFSDLRTDEERIAKLGTICDAKYIPPDAANRFSKKDLPELIAEILDTSIKDLAAYKTPVEWVPLLNVTYADGARMVTYGGILADEADRVILSDLALTDLEFHASRGQFDIALPHLTYKEKLELDRLMPSAAPPKAKSLPFELRENEIEAYWKFYLQYPVFGELQV